MPTNQIRQHFKFASTNFSMNPKYPTPQPQDDGTHHSLIDYFHGAIEGAFAGALAIATWGGIRVLEDDWRFIQGRAGQGGVVGGAAIGGAIEGGTSARAFLLHNSQSYIRPRH